LGAYTAFKANCVSTTKIFSFLRKLFPGNRSAMSDNTNNDQAKRAFQASKAAQEAAARAAEETVSEITRKSIDEITDFEMAKSLLRKMRKALRKTTSALTAAASAVPQEEPRIIVVSPGSASSKSKGKLTPDKFYLHTMITQKHTLDVWAAVLQNHRAETISAMIQRLSTAAQDGTAIEFVAAFKLLAQQNSVLATRLIEFADMMAASHQHLIASTAEQTKLMQEMCNKLMDLEEKAELTSIPDLEQRKQALATQLARESFVTEATQQLGNKKLAEAAWAGIANDPELLEERVQKVLNTENAITTQMLREYAPTKDLGGDTRMEPAEQQVREMPQPKNLSASFAPAAVLHGPHTTGSAPTLRFVLPQPPKFRGELDQHVTDAKIWQEHVMAYLGEHGKDFCTYLPYYLEGKALEWGRGQIKMLQDENRLTAEQLQQDFLLRYDDLLFPASKKARDRLYDGSYKMQKGEEYVAYQQRFREIARDTTDMSQADKIEWFIRGLKSSIEEEVTTNRGKMWATLEEVITYANGVDRAQRVAAARAATNRSPAVSLNAAHAHNNNRFGKRPFSYKRKQEQDFTPVAKRVRAGDKKGPQHNAAGAPGGSGVKQPKTCGHCKQPFEGHYMMHAASCKAAQAYYAKKDADKSGKGKY
jgi:hypothetical protein